MPLQISIPDDDIRHLNQPAKDALERSVRGFSNDLLREASRLEAADNTMGQTPQITSSMITDAALFLKRAYRKPKKGKLLIVVQSVAAVTAFVSGLVADFDKLKEPWVMVTFLAILSIAIASNVIAVLKE